MIIRGVHQVCSSHALRRLFIYILQIGNLLNFGTESDQNGTVGGFSLNSLVKLSQTKAFVGGITFLQYVVQSIEVRAVLPELKYLLMAYGNNRELIFSIISLADYSEMCPSLLGSTTKLI